MSTDRARRSSASTVSNVPPPSRTLRARPPPPPPAAPSPGAPGTPAPRKRVRVSQTPEVMERVRQSAAYIFFLDLLERLYVKPEAEGFRAPVLDLWEESAVPGYLSVIDTPMDLGTVKMRLKDGFYNRYHQVAPFVDEDAIMRDVRLVFQNCMTYNDSDSELYDVAKELLAFANKAVRPRMEQRRQEERQKEEMQRERKLQRDRERRARIKAERQEENKRAAEGNERAVEEDERTADEDKRAAEEERELRKKRKRERDIERRAAKKARDMEERAKKAARHARLKAQRQAAAAAEREAVEAAAREVAEQKAREEEQIRELARKRKRKKTGADVQAPKAAVRQRRDERSTSSISSDEVAEIEEEIDEVREMHLTFVSTKGMEKKRGRKSVVAQSLEAKHDELMRQRRQLVEARMEVERRRHVALTEQEKRDLCAKVRVVGFLQMKGVVQLIAQGMNRPDILCENEVDIDVERVDTHVLRDVEFFLENAPLATALQSLGEIERKLTDIEAEYVSLRYHIVNRR